MEREFDPRDYAVAMVGITKQFPGVLANDNVTLLVRKGEIHAVVGENGAGKTTLMNQLYGLLRPDSGKIYVFGRELNLKGPRDAINAGIGMVHQHFMLVDNLTVAENIVLGSETRRGVIFDLRQARMRVKELSESYGLMVDVDAKIEDIPVGMQQRVEILKTLYRGAEILILDEPTAVLTPQETEELFEILRKLREAGKTIIFITHKLNEVMAVTDRVTVMRQGKVTGNLITKETNPREIARLMVGREVLLRVEKQPNEPDDVVVEVEDLWVKDNRNLDAVKGVSFYVRAGEIVGIAGVAGNGQTELVEALTGLRKAHKGKYMLLGQDVTNLSARELRLRGLAHIPEDRHKYGLVLDFPNYYNAILGRHDQEPFCRSSFLDHDVILKYTKELFETFDVRPRIPEMPSANLSGGNQQKLVVAREMSSRPKFIVISQPTRGLDIGAIEYIHKTILRLRDENVAVLLVSMELDEVMSLSDRIYVMYEGRFTGEVRPEEVTLEEMGLMMAGHTWEEVRGTVATR
ncbi:MAG: ral nucleoside transport system ATP-binding protein [Thermotogota bacterium]|nr:ral nucleoside transport system ATP-binding protein [Thermotogota bacterium]MDK2864017.1 ral nucleoside transport system ATP-binding protein [Thermotogota bacterium]HCZ06225.1 heme ABC transporter ATP-binding protein [Thermotogota bacterium]